MNYSAQMNNPQTSNWLLVTLAAAACLMLQTGCSRERPALYFTGQAYLHLQQGETFVAPREMTLATESVVQEKDEMILDLLQANAHLQTTLDLRGP